MKTFNWKNAKKEIKKVKSLYQGEIYAGIDIAERIIKDNIKELEEITIKNNNSSVIIENNGNSISIKWGKCK